MDASQLSHRTTPPILIPARPFLRTIHHPSAYSPPSYPRPRTANDWIGLALTSTRPDILLKSAASCGDFTSIGNGRSYHDGNSKSSHPKSNLFPSLFTEVSGVGPAAYPVNDAFYGPSSAESWLLASADESKHNAAISKSSMVSPLMNYQYLNPPPLISRQPPAPPEKRAIVSTLYSDSYAIGVAVLGHSVRRANVTGRLLLPHLAGRVSEQALCITRAVGWEPIAVPFIPPPHDGKGVYHRFVDQYTKLNIWGLDKHRVEQAVYLDADTLVLRNFEELFDVPFNFAAVPDIYGDKRGFTVNFNAGVLVFRPSSTVLETMKEKLETAQYPLKQAEQSFLNLVFSATALRLPYAYNANLAIKRSSPAMWKGMRDEMRIVHYTLTKPFVDEWASKPKLMDEGELRRFMDRTAESHDGLFAEEVGWWREAYDRMMDDVRGKIEACYHRASPTG
ncbi:putative glycosyl transferase family 8 [Lyophyllum shimeji]|uniref:Glycosyl transferase family 8 n=1 Tax=Lyophyllum shimeji TaxID=47721 RepID=A0A9P3PQM4_LYOSH|nr:putative glycosyl transferase family 8 [Lyophyllum shimeji]